MSPVKIFLFVTLVIVAVLSQNSGFKTTLSKRGIDYIRDVAMNALRAELGQLKIPDQHTETGTPIGKIQLWLRNFAITGINFPNPNINIVPNSHLQIIADGIAINLNFNWRWEKRSFPRASDSGSGIINVANTRLHIDLALVPMNGKFQAQIRGLVFNINHFDIKLRGGASWLYNIIIKNMRGKIRDQIQNQIAQAITKEINGKLNQELAKVPMVVPVKDAGVSLDYSVVDLLVYQESYLTIPAKGEFFVTDNRTRSEHSPARFADYLGENKMLHFLLSDYVVRTAAEAFHKKGKLVAWISDKDIPSWSPVRLNSSSWGMLIPNLQRTFPNQELKIQMHTIKNPDFEIRSQNATARVYVDLTMFALDGQGQMKQAFTLTGYVVAAGKAGIVGHNVVGELLFVAQKFQLKSTQIGEFSVQMFDDIMNMLFDKGIIPALNVYLRNGVRLPTLGNVELIAPEVRWGESYLSISADLKYNK